MEGTTMGVQMYMGASASGTGKGIGPGPGNTGISGTIPIKRQ